MKRILSLLLLAVLAIPAHAQKISADPTAAALSGGEFLAGVQSAANVKVLPSQILTYALANLYSVNAQSGTTYTYLAGDRGKMVTHSNASAIAGTLPQATGSFGSGWFMWVQNRGAGSLTITPTTSTIDGAATLVLTTGQGVFLMSDGTNYFTEKGSGGGGVGGSVTSVAASGGVQTTTGSAITATGTIQGANVTNAQSGTSYAILTGDRGKHVAFTNNASPIAATIAQAGTTGFEDGWFTILEVRGTQPVTLTPTTSTINGASTLTLVTGMWAIVYSDATNYEAIVVDPAGVTPSNQTTTSYTVLNSDRGKLLNFNNASAIAVTLPVATAAGFGNRWFAYFGNRGVGTVTITPTTSTIDGNATLVLTSNMGALVASDGTNYFTMRVPAAAGALSFMTESRNTASPNGTTNAVRLQVTDANTSNMDLVLQPRGTGALLAQLPDSSTTGGNKRGLAATDLQMTRSAATMVASGANGAAILGGQNNTASGNAAFVGAGDTSLASGNLSVVVGGQTNTASSLYAVSIGGTGNSATTNQAATTLGGNGNTSSGNNSATVAGTSNLSSGTNSVAAGGNNTADAANSFALGTRAITRGVLGVLAWSSGRFSADGDAQKRETILRAVPTSTSSFVATTDGGAASATNQLLLPSGSAMTVRGQVLLRDTSAGTAGRFEITYALLKNVAGTVTLVNSAVGAYLGDAALNACTVTVSADNTNKTFQVAITGVAATTIHAVVELTALETQ